MEFGPDEADDLRDPPVHPTHELHRARPVVDFCPPIECKRHLAVRSRRDDPEPRRSVLREARTVKETLHVGSTAKPGGVRRHREDDILLQERDQRIYVVSFPAADVSA